MLATAGALNPWGRAVMGCVGSRQGARAPSSGSQCGQVQPSLPEMGTQEEDAIWDA